MRHDTRLPLWEPAALDDAQRGLYSEITEGPRSADRARSPIVDEQGRLLGPFNAMLFNPELGLPMQGLGAALRYRTSLTAARREMATLLVSAWLDSPFEWLAHEPLARAAGLSEEVISAIAAGREPPLSGDDALVYRGVEGLLAHGDLDDARYSDLRAAVGDTACVELVVLVGYYRMLALVLKTFRVPVPDGADHA